MDILNLCLAILFAFLLGIQQAFSIKLTEEKAEQKNHNYNPLATLILNQNANHNQDTTDSLKRVKRQYGRRYPYPPVWIGGGGFGIGPGFGRGFGGYGFGGRGIGSRGGFGGRGGGGHGGGGHGGGGGGHGGGGGRG